MEKDSRSPTPKSLKWLGLSMGVLSVIIWFWLSSSVVPKAASVFEDALGSKSNLPALTQACLQPFFHPARLAIPIVPLLLGIGCLFLQARGPVIAITVGLIGWCILFPSVVLMGIREADLKIIDLARDRLEASHPAVEK